MIRFAAVADIQYADQDDAIGRHYRESLQKFIATAGEFAEAGVDFAMNFGDVWDRGWENALAIKEILQVSEDKGGLRWRHVLGNHDFLVPDDHKKDVYKLLGLEKPGYYDFSPVDSDDPDNKWRVIVLNGNEISLYSAENAEEKENARKERAKRKLANGSEPHNYNGSVSERQLQWLEDRLKTAQSQNENVLVCSHFPLFAMSRSIKSNRAMLASMVNLGIYYPDMGVSTWNGREILEMIDRYPCVRAYMAGHLHEGSYGERNNVAHITLRGVIETSKNASAYVELGRKSIRVEGHGEQQSIEFTFDPEENNG